ncbi:hypothetical protein KSP40_PGU020846 [Platanthera guangdongensis]|uniref:Calmodulin binding protein-like N-terminal domain-containing protein n=1 Tax=Platanthera guangdongensis TaxID=2320717 RepID=A0ABR2MGF8_9ASPA
MFDPCWRGGICGDWMLGSSMEDVVVSDLDFIEPIFEDSKLEGLANKVLQWYMCRMEEWTRIFNKTRYCGSRGDFNNEDDEESTDEEFENHVVKEREGKRPLMTGDLQVTLKEGVGTLGELTFTDNYSWIRSRKFRLGLKISSRYCDGIRVREGKTEAFTVKDHIGECSDMSNKMWDILIEHVKNCRSRSSSSKAVVWWLKIKAAMRWGIFIRKKAAERRAQIIELEDE